MKKKALSSKTLATQVVARQKFLEETLRFATSVVSRRGKVLFREVHKWHTETKEELRNFASFSFYSYGSHTMFGGETVKIWYHPGSEKLPPEPFLEVEWWDIKECRVKRFDQSPGWQRAIKVVMKNEKRIAKAFETKQKNAEERARRVVERDKALHQEEVHLASEAKRLGLS